MSVQRSPDLGPGDENVAVNAPFARWTQLSVAYFPCEGDFDDVLGLEIRIGYPGRRDQ